MSGLGGLLLDVSGRDYDEQIQQRLWSLSQSLDAVTKWPGVTETVLGINNLLLIFDPLVLHPDLARERLLAQWLASPPMVGSGRELELDMLYGGSAGDDLSATALALGMDVDELVYLHSSPVYTVAATSSMPGFAFLSGLPSRLHIPRRQTPRSPAGKGSVMIGASQVAILPCRSPTGWHVLGAIDIPLFDPNRNPPSYFRPGDRVKFCVKGVQV